ncbi:MAG: peptidoglycan D,D-transpeptidase FtsI family protein [Rhodothalassiaceae bacterium]
MIRTHIDLEARRRRLIERSRHRLMVALLLFIGAFTILAARTVELGVLRYHRPDTQFASDAARLSARADIVDRNGLILATNVAAASLFADPHLIADPEQAVIKLRHILPDQDAETLRRKLQSDRRFVWIKRRLTPEQMWRVNSLGLPGLDFQEEEERIYPHGRLAAHLIGFVGDDGQGLHGVEHFFQRRLSDPTRVHEPLTLSLDMRVQHILTDALTAAQARHRAKAAVGLVLDVRNGETLALASLPDFDPNAGAQAPKSALMNRATLGVYELGSVFKTFTLAAALDAGVVDLSDGYDASRPIRVARHAIRDHHPKNRWLSVPEIFAFSSNIGAAKMAMDLGTARQRQFLGQLGLLSAPAYELTEIGAPLLPSQWHEVETMTVSFGHGLAVSPLQLGRAMAAMVNGGDLVPVTLLKRQWALGTEERRPVISADTSAQMRQLMRLVVSNGTGQHADIAGYHVGGKTGTAEKASAGGYDRGALLSSFVAAFPIQAPRYLVFVMLDEPIGIEATHQFAGGGWVAAPAVGEIIARIAPMLGLPPVPADPGYVREAALYMME